MINRATITYFGKQIIVRCDRNCKKAWGINSRPCKQLSDNPDDIVYLADGELGDAPIDPGTYEGLEMAGKPLNPDEFPTKWCVRECERSKRGKGELPNWNKPIYNLPQRTDKKVINEC